MNQFLYTVLVAVLQLVFHAELFHTRFDLFPCVLPTLRASGPDVIFVLNIGRHYRATEDLARIELAIVCAQCGKRL